MSGALIAMSGGVDSSVTAYLMKERGYDCRGAILRLRGGDASEESFRRDVEDAAQAAGRLGIPFEVIDCAGEFRREVVDKFVRVYEAGGIPNPCIDCNRRLKFGALLQAALERGMDCVATGHYARVERDKVSGRMLLRKALDASKDQSYVLCMLTQEQLARARFPLGEMDKARTRALAAELGLSSARRRDSQDICFVPGGDYAAFLERYTGKAYPEGDYLDLSGRVVGRHRGAVRYTPGQRKGLGLAMGEPVYVCRKDMANNSVTVGPDAALYTKLFYVEDLNWIAIEQLDAPLRLKAKTRYRQAEQWANVRPAGEGRARVEFDEPQRAIAPGQTCAFYEGDVVVGGGTIVDVPGGAGGMEA